MSVPRFRSYTEHRIDLHALQCRIQSVHGKMLPITIGSAYSGAMTYAGLVSPKSQKVTSHGRAVSQKEMTARVPPGFPFSWGVRHEHVIQYDSIYLCVFFHFLVFLVKNTNRIIIDAKVSSLTQNTFWYIYPIREAMLLDNLVICHAET